MMPTTADVAAFLGKPGDAATLALAASHMPVVTHMVRGYVRDKGFTGDQPRDDLAAVIVSATARLTSNPGATAERTFSIDDYTETIRQGTFNGWTLPELAILHRYRRRAM